MRQARHQPFLVFIFGFSSDQTLDVYESMMPSASCFFLLVEKTGFLGLRVPDVYRVFGVSCTFT
jgi:hypothetical protein